MGMINLEEKASKIRSLITNIDPYMEIIKISPSSGIDLSISKRINEIPNHLAYFYIRENKVLWKNQDYEIFFENLKEKYKKEFNQELGVEKWIDYNINFDELIEQDE